MSGKTRECTAPGCGGVTVARRLCRKHYQAAWKAGELGAHKTEPVKYRKHGVCPSEHRHGASGTCYVHHKCRCEDCVSSTSKRNYRRLQLKAYGRYDTGLVDVAPVREHVLMLAEYGIGYKRLAKICGYRSSTPVRTIIWGRQDSGPRFGEMQKRVKRETAIRILRVRPTVELLADGAVIPARGAHRRVQALVALGWSLSRISERLGMDPGNFSMMMQRERVRASTHRSIAVLFDELWDQAPPEDSSHDVAAATRARKYAADRGWVTALAWDDIDLDEAPDIGTAEDERTVDDQAVELAVTGVPVRLHPVERRAAVERLHGLRLSDSEIAHRLGITDRTVLRIREELSLAAWTIAEQRAGIEDRRAA